jgi:DHA1 family chloramphenicol resistance protein-like MFS transporter
MASAPASPSPAPRPTRLPAAVYVIALTIFALGTSEFMIAGLLPDLAADLDVSIPAAGSLISAFAIGMLVGAPVMALLTLRFPRRTTMLVACVVFAAAHVVGTVSDDYGLLLATRVVAAVACATFWAVGAVTAVALAPEGSTARALAVVLGGLTLANVLGVPAGTWIGETWGWQSAFAAVAVATVVSTVATVLFVPDTGGDGASTPMRQRVAAELEVFGQARLWAALATTMTFQAAVFCAFSYFAPLLTDVSGIASSRVPAVLLVFGVGTFIGITIGGRYADRHALLNVFVSLAAMSVSLVALAIVAHSSALVVAGVFAFGVTSFSIASALNARVFGFAAAAPTLAAAVNVSAFNVGNAAGPWIGGLAISAGLGYVAPVWFALGLTVLALGFATVSWAVEREPTCETAACVAGA